MDTPGAPVNTHAATLGRDSALGRPDALTAIANDERGHRPGSDELHLPFESPQSAAVLDSGTVVVGAYGRVAVLLEP